MNKVPKYNPFHRIWLALIGIFIAIKRERHLKVHIVLSILFLIPLIFLDITTTHAWIMLILVIQLIILELVNTAIELTVDLVTRKFSYRAKLAKDISSGAVLLSAAVTASFAIFIYSADMYNFLIGVFIGS